MNPFSARYFIKNNFSRVFMIVLMISMLALIYVGGLYLTNICEEALAIANETQDFVSVRTTIDDTDGEQLGALAEEISSDQSLEVFGVVQNYYRYKTMLGFRNGWMAYVFSREDFIRFNERMKLIPTDTELPDNAVILSEKEAKYLRMDNGELIQEISEDLDVYYGRLPLQVITYPGKSFSAYFVTDEFFTPQYYLFTWKAGGRKDDFFKRVEQLRARYNNLEFKTYDDIIKELKDNFEINNVIYYSIIAIMSIVFAITTNAVFVGLYDRRKQEFALYKGIGIDTKRIYRKMAAEILYMNGMGLILGVGISLLAVTLLNEYIYHKDGMSMWYYHPTAFFAVVLCDLAILIPGIGLRIRNISRDIKDVSFL